MQAYLSNTCHFESRHFVTGITPHEDSDAFLAAKNHPLKKFARKVNRRLNTKTPRTKMYRRFNELPLDINEVISLLTHHDSKRQCTVRYARTLPWIKKDNGDDVNVTEGESSVTAHPCMKTGGPIKYLRCSSLSDSFVAVCDKQVTGGQP